MSRNLPSRKCIQMWRPSGLPTHFNGGGWQSEGGEGNHRKGPDPDGCNETSASKGRLTGSN